MNKAKMTRREFCKASMLSLAAAGLSSGFQPGCSRQEQSVPVPKNRPNIIIFLVDMLRPDHLGIYGYPKKTSPNIDRLARQGIVFDNAYSPCPWTYPSVVSLLTGLAASSHGAFASRKKITLSKADLWLPALFKKYGYSTVGFHTHPYLRKNVSNIYSAFDEYYDPSDKKRGKKRFSDHMYLDTLYPACESWLENNYQNPFFMYIHAIDVHGPYNKMRVLEEDKGQLNRLLKEKYVFPGAGHKMFASTTHGSRPYPYKSLFYDGHIFSVDSYVARLFNKLQSLGIGEDTLLILTSDHGEGFGEHNYWNHGRSVYDHQIRIPLIFSSHKMAKQKAGRIGGLVNTVGLIPTLLDMLGINIDKYIDGKTFLPLISSGDSNKWSYNSLSGECLGKFRKDYDAFMTEPGFKLITEKKTGRQLLFNLKEDPHELHPVNAAGKLSGRSEEILSGLVKKRKDVLRSIRKRKKISKKLGKDTLEELKTLGYL